MQVTAGTINVGNEQDTRNMVMDLLSFLDIFSVFDGQNNVKGKYIEKESWNNELSSLWGGIFRMLVEDSEVVVE